MGAPDLNTMSDRPSDGPFEPLPWSISQIRAAIPSELFQRSATRSLLYLSRDLLMASCCWWLAVQIDPFFAQPTVLAEYGSVRAEVGKWTAWGLYWWFQGLIFTGIWVIGHECGHGAFSNHTLLNDTIGFITHSLLWTPYFSWKISHHRHHFAHGSMERDEVYVPKTRSDLGLPAVGEADENAYEELLGDTPIYTLFMLVRQQLLAFPAYLLFNVSGQKTYPKWTNHFDPGSVLFTPAQRMKVHLSTAGLFAVGTLVCHACAVYGASTVLKLYGIPWLCVSHWFIMITYLHHTDPNLPHYRGQDWTFARGAASTMDRPILGWQGRFFLHDVAHFHVVHHFFPTMPWYHGELATAHLRQFLGKHYRASTEPTFKALWHNYNACQFVEDDGNILFYRDRKGHAVCEDVRTTSAAT